MLHGFDGVLRTQNYLEQIPPLTTFSYVIVIEIIIGSDAYEAAVVRNDRLFRYEAKS